MIQMLESGAAPHSPTVDKLLELLHASPYWSVRQLGCHVDRGWVVICGTVPTYYMKQVAQTVVMKAIGPERFRSEIDVQAEL